LVQKGIKISVSGSNEAILAHMHASAQFKRIRQISRPLKFQRSHYNKIAVCYKLRQNRGKESHNHILQM
jgi:hypothetical protein